MDLDTTAHTASGSNSHRLSDLSGRGICVPVWRQTERDTQVGVLVLLALAGFPRFDLVSRSQNVVRLQLHDIAVLVG